MQYRLAVVVVRIHVIFIDDSQIEGQIPFIEADEPRDAGSREALTSFVVVLSRLFILELYSNSNANSLFK